MIVRMLRMDEIEKLYPLADKFFSASEFLIDFNREHFKAQWMAFLTSGCGVIFCVEMNTMIVGVIGAIKFNDPNNGYLLASELFWFVDPEHRGCGKELLDRFESWAKEQGCKYVIMVYLMDSMPEIVKRIYDKRGYKPMEVHYVKEI